MQAPVDALVNPELFRALGDPTRARIAVCLCKCSRPCSVSEIAECCSVDLSVVSRHLAILERACLLESTRHGRTVLYRVRYDILVQSFRSLADAIELCWSACGQADRGGGLCCPPSDSRPGASTTARCEASPGDPHNA